MNYQEYSEAFSSARLNKYLKACGENPYAALTLYGQSLLQVFPLRTKGLGQRAVYNELQSIKEFRNRIAHHEAICFDKTGMKNTAYARESYRLIQKYIHFLGYRENHLLFGLDIFPDAILQKIDTL